MKAKPHCGVDALRSLFVGLLLAVLCGASVATPINWHDKKFTYVAQNKPIKDFLREFGASQGVIMVVSPDIEGTLNGKFDMAPQSMLDLVAATYSIIWYYDGNILFLYPSSEASTEVIRSHTSKIDELRSTVERLGIADPKYPIIFDTRKNTALVSGPKRYIELVRQTMQAIDANDSANVPTDVQVFRLKYAWAADHAYTQGGHTYHVPGVSTVLQKLYGGGGQVASVGAGSSSEEYFASAAQKMRALGLISQGDSGRVAALSALGTSGTPKGGSSSSSYPTGDDNRSASSGSSGLPHFEADSRLNAVIVRDTPERMAYHRAIIQSLDVKPQLVEIEARIIEVSSDAMDNLGLDWRLKTHHYDGQLNNSGLPTLPFDGSTNTPDVRGGLLTAIAGNSARYLIARVNALSQQGKANILSSPKVTTLDNVEAVIENLQTFFVRVAGNLDVGLYQVSAGTSMRVTPLVVNEGGGAQIKLAVRIEDGRVNPGASVDNIPTLNQSNINSESFVRSGESLLIAGYASEATTNDTSGVPGLSRIPLLGNLFKYKEEHKTRVERLFMLTPRVVTLQ